MGSCTKPGGGGRFRLSKIKSATELVYGLESALQFKFLYHNLFQWYKQLIQINCL